MGVLQTEFEFTLPIGYVDDEGNLHKQGAMKLATAADEIFPWKDPRIEKNDRYYDLIFLSRVVIRLGTLSLVNTDVIAKLFLEDFHYLKNMAVAINQPKIAQAATQEEPPEMSRIYQEVTFLAYFLHWDYNILMNMEHQERQRWCKEVSNLHQKMNEENKIKSAKTIEDIS